MRRSIVVLLVVLVATVVLLAGPCKPDPVYQLPQLPPSFSIDVSATNTAANSELVEFTFDVRDLRTNEVVATARAATTAGQWVQATQRFAGTEILFGQAVVDATGTVEYIVTVEKGTSTILRREGKTAVVSKQGT